MGYARILCCLFLCHVCPFLLIKSNRSLIHFGHLGTLSPVRGRISSLVLTLVVPLLFGKYCSINKQNNNRNRKTTIGSFLPRSLRQETNVEIKGLYSFQYLLLGTGASTFSPYDGFPSLSYSLRFLRVSAKKRVIPPLPAHHGNPVVVKGKRICSRV